MIVQHVIISKNQIFDYNIDIEEFINYNKYIYETMTIKKFLDLSLDDCFYQFGLCFVRSKKRNIVFISMNAIVSSNPPFVKLNGVKLKNFKVYYSKIKCYFIETIKNYIKFIKIIEERMDELFSLEDNNFNNYI